MTGKIWRYDCYDLRKFKPGDIDVFLDIGANIGTTSLQAKVLNPTARVIALEPVKETFDKLFQHMFPWMKCGIECYNIALGDGTPMYFQRRGHSGMHRFFTKEETEKWPEGEYGYATGSKTIKQIFEDYKISTDKPYLIKIDCEGGERFFLQQKEALDYVRGSVQTMMEIHLGLGGTKEKWNLWFKELSDTHELRIGGHKYKGTPDRRFIFTACDNNEMPFDSGMIAIELVNRKWIGPWPGKNM